jgi:hypothetical protein
MSGVKVWRYVQSHTRYPENDFPRNDTWQMVDTLFEKVIHHPNGIFSSWPIGISPSIQTTCLLSGTINSTSDRSFRS